MPDDRPPHDALDPGPEGDHPNVPRHEDGSVDRERFPRGLRRNRQRGPGPREGRPTLIDLTMRTPEGEEIAPDEPEEG